MENQREAAKRRLDEEWTREGDDPDFAGLHQGVEGTMGRHEAVIGKMHDIYGAVPRVVVDYGCGTALLLKTMHDKGLNLPARYIGVDFLEHRRQSVERRLTHYGVNGCFLCTDDIATAHKELNEKNREMAMVIAIGILGYRGIHTLKQISHELIKLRNLFPMGVVTVPRQLPERLGEEDMARYDPDDLQEAMPANMFRYTRIYTDTLVSWG